MNNIKGSGWILCPSKTFPGKFYYFNGLTGETAWSHGDQVKIMKKYGGIHSVMGSCHHPEPSSPPDPCKADSINSQLNFSFKQYPTNAFSQLVFPMPLKVKNESTILWSPNQTQKPLVIPPETRVQSNQYKPSNTDKIWLQSEGNSAKPWEHNKELSVQTCNQPLWQSFVDNEKTVVHFNQGNKIANTQEFDKFYTSTSVNKFNLTNSVQAFDTIASNTELFQLKNNNNISYLEPTITKQRHLIKEPTLNIEVPSKSIEKVHTMHLKKSAFGHCNKVYFGMKADLGSEKKLNMNCDDLRMLLLAKKRKTFGVKTNVGEPGCKKARTTNQEPSLTKKRVTYNLETEYSCIDNEHVDDNTNFADKYISTSEMLKELAGPGLRKDHWCIVVDAKTLLEEFTFLDKFVKLDPLCRLLVPSSVFSEISALSKGLCADRTRVTLAKNVIRRLVNSHIIVKTADDEGTLSPASEAILECCVKTIDQNIHLILISNNQELLTTAKWYAIHRYRLNDIKQGLAPITELASDMQKMKISIPNDAVSKNMQNDVEHKFGRISFEESEDLNDKEKEIIRKFRQIDKNPQNVKEKSTMTNENSMTENKNLRISNGKSIKFDNHLMTNSVLNTAKYVNNSNISLEMTNTNSRITGQKSMMINTNAIANANSNIDDMKYLMIINENSKNTYENSKFENTNSMINKPLTSIPKFSITNPTVSSRMSMKHSKIFNDNSEALTAWRCPASDITETTNVADMKKLSQQTNPLQNNYKIPEKNKSTLPENQNTNVSFYFKSPAPKTDLSKLISTSRVIQNVSPHFENSRENCRSSMFDVNPKPNNEIDDENNIFQSLAKKYELSKLKSSSRVIQNVSPHFGNSRGNRRSSIFDDNPKPNNDIANENNIFQSPDPIFETNEVEEEPLKSVGEIGKEQSKMGAYSFTIGCDNNPQNVQSDNVIEKNNENLDISRFCVGNNIMKNRLEKRFDEWMCTFKQYMEETLSSILKKISGSVLKSMAPPWSLYEALQCIKVVCISHSVVRTTVNQLCGFLYNTSGSDNFKENINLNDFMKAIGCGIHLIKYLKKILLHPADIFDGEECLVKLLNDIEDPLSDPIEPPIRPPAMPANVEDIEVRRNYIKTRSEIMDYLNCVTNDAASVAAKNVDGIAKKKIDNIPATDTESDRTEIIDTNSTKKIVDDIATYKESEKAEKKLSHKQNSKIPFKTILKNLPKITKTIENKCVDAREHKKCKNETKPKTKITYHNVKPKENRQIIDMKKNIQTNKFKFDDKLLAVKIAIPNNKQVYLQNEKEVCKRTDTMNVINNKLQSNEDKEIESTNFKPKGIKKDVENPKLIANDPVNSEINNTVNEYNKVEINNNEPIVKRNGFKNDAAVNDAKPYKGDVTVVKSFISELDDYIKHIHGIMDGCIREFQNGQIQNETKKLCKLKAVKANLLITKIIIMLKKLTQKVMTSGGQNVEVSSEEHVSSKKINPVVECLDKAQMLQKTLNRILTVTSGDGSTELTG